MLPPEARAGRLTGVGGGGRVLERTLAAGSDRGAGFPRSTASFIGTGWGRPRTFAATLGSLPEGVFVSVPGGAAPLLVWRAALWPWSPAGYGGSGGRPASAEGTVLTPRSTVAAIAAGYTPIVHESLGR